MHLKGFNNEKGQRQYKNMKRIMSYDLRLISREDVDRTQDNCLTRLTLCITRAGYSKRDVCFPWLGVSKMYPQISWAFTDCDLSLMVRV